MTLTNLEILNALDTKISELNTQSLGKLRWVHLSKTNIKLYDAVPLVNLQYLWTHNI